MLPSFSPSTLKFEQDVPRKRWYISTRIRDATTQTTIRTLSTLKQLKDNAEVRGSHLFPESEAANMLAKKERGGACYLVNCRAWKTTPSRYTNSTRTCSCFPKLSRATRGIRPTRRRTLIFSGVPSTRVYYYFVSFRRCVGDAHNRRGLHCQRHCRTI